MANTQQFRNSIKIQRCREDLVEGLDDVSVKVIVDCLLTKLFITHENKDVIQAEKTGQDKARELLDLIYRKVESQDKVKKSDLFDEFVECLRKYNSCLASTVEMADDSVPNKALNIDDILVRVKDINLDEKILKCILMNVSSGWEHVATELGVSHVKLSIAKQNSSDVDIQMFEVFKAWRRIQPSETNALSKLLEVFDRCSYECKTDLNKILESVTSPHKEKIR
ncbi:uncharacterized protein LOC106868333 isoform X1 [Octopus bimaculoides]|nr:uncharacterized protein LOC106868333 isoform X1 [Octopus bimaculoides]XP_052828592.1 uncharacterized protein LOC106868333 isoform X1 [Octopus bimaculoides]|eukprot:XP_014769020.1 PREDICTED: uncharacterized protein LOC106868333 [Octopus bimaculoides]